MRKGKKMAVEADQRYREAKRMYDLGFVAHVPPHPSPEVVQREILAAAKEVSVMFNCTVSIAYKDENNEVQTAWRPDGGPDGRAASTEDKFAFGSMTKMVTGASIMRLVAEGKLGLDDEVAPLLNPIFNRLKHQHRKTMSFRALQQLWGKKNMKKLTVRRLLAMTSGIPDFDTASPCEDIATGCEQTDRLRRHLYSKPNYSFTPTELMSLPWVKHHWYHANWAYSSTGYILLGFVLAAHANVTEPYDLDQAQFLPPEVANQLRFATTQTPRELGCVPGHDRTTYNQKGGQVNNHENGDVAGVFSGWTGSNAVGTPKAIADLVWAIYGPHPTVAPKRMIAEMIPARGSVYGLATHNIGADGMGFIGQKPEAGPYSRAWGHMGATFGYQSISSYFPALNFALAITTDLENDQQAHPALALCFSYNRIAAHMLNMQIRCQRAEGTYWGGGCKCTTIDDRRNDPKTQRAAAQREIEKAEREAWKNL